MKRYIRRYLHPTQIVILSFALVILIGTALLSLPFASRSGERMPLLDAFFTATSATCVTGLVVVDTGTTFSLFGQLVILACIQVGGLGLMTLTTVFVVLAGRRVAIADRIAVQESFHHTPTGNIRTLVKYIIVATLSIEAAGAAVLMLHWTAQGRFGSFGETAYSAIFHSVSAFCNAGFSLHADSLVGYQNDSLTVILMSVLIIIGGLGFLVSLDIKGYVQQRYFEPLWSSQVRERVQAIRTRPRLSVHTKFVLTTTAALLLIGTVSYYFLERNGLFAGMSPQTIWLNAYFCSVTPRTAGFNTIDFAAMSGAGLLCTMVLMFIGASPGSTGGGVKTSTFGVLVAYSLSRWRGQAHLNAFNRTVPQVSIDRAGSVVIAAVVLVILAASVLMSTETIDLTSRASQTRFLSIAFETISAFGTVGLSMGETPTMSFAGKLLIAVVMFLGRIGPLSLALAISRRQRRAQYRYAEENIMVG